MEFIMRERENLDAYKCDECGSEIKEKDILCVIDFKKGNVNALCEKCMYDLRNKITDEYVKYYDKRIESLIYKDMI